MRKRSKAASATHPLPSGARRPDDPAARARSVRAQHQPYPSGRGTQQRDRDCRIIATQHLTSNTEAVALDVKCKLRHQFQCRVPCAPLRGRVTAEAQHVVERARAESLGDHRQQRVTHPGAQVFGVAVGRVVVMRKFSRGDVRGQLGARERQQGADESATRARGDPREAGGATAAQHTQQDRLDLIVAMMRGDEVARAAAALDLTEFCVARAAGRGLGRVGAEVQLTQFEGQPQLRRQRTDRLSDRPTVRLDAVIDVRHDQLEAELRRDAM